MNNRLHTDSRITDRMHIQKFNTKIPFHVDKHPLDKNGIICPPTCILPPWLGIIEEMSVGRDPDVRRTSSSTHCFRQWGTEQRTR